MSYYESLAVHIFRNWCVEQFVRRQLTFNKPAYNLDLWGFVSATRSSDRPRCVLWSSLFHFFLFLWMNLTSTLLCMTGFVHYWGLRVKGHVQGSHILGTVNLTTNLPAWFLFGVVQFCAFLWPEMIEKKLKLKRWLEPVKRDETRLVSFTRRL